MTTISPVDNVARAFAETVADLYDQRVGERFTMALSGGPTALLCYQQLAADSGDIDWSRVDIYMGDERLVGPDDPDANQRQVREALIEHVGPVGSFTPMPTDGAGPDCAARYQVVIAALLAGPGLDLIHLGLGPDGHTASLFPGAVDLDVPDDVLVRATVDPNGTNPHPRLSLTLPAIDQARCALFTVSGPTKRDAVAKVQADADIPANRVHAHEVRWLVDRAALDQD